MKNIVFLFSVLAFFGISQAAADDLPVSLKGICHQASEARIPASDSADKDAAAKLAHCDAWALYYGYESPPDFVQARQCAYLKKEYGILTMIYANGQGVQRNWELAIHFACLAGFAPEEVEGRIEHLKSLQAKNAATVNFDICDDITSGYMMGVCADKQAHLEASKRRRELIALMAAWNEENKKSFDNLQKAAQAFFTARSQNEIDLSGTGRGAFEIEERSSLEDDLLSSLEMLEKGQFPSYDADQWRKADNELNDIFNQIEKNPDFSIGTIDRRGIRETEKAWLKYRDAWVAFGTQKYPQVTPDSWKTWLTKKRIEMLSAYEEN